MATWNYDPSLPTDLDVVRFLIGDTDQRNQLIYDEEITAILTRKSNDTRSTAIMLCESLAARYSKFTDVRAGETTSDKTAISGKFMARANELRRWKVKGFAITTQSAKDTNDENTDRLSTSIKRDMDVNNQSC